MILEFKNQYNFHKGWIKYELNKFVRWKNNYIWSLYENRILSLFRALFIPERIADMLDKKVMDIEASEAYLDHQISGMRQQKKTHDWIYNELK